MTFSNFSDELVTELKKLDMPCRFLMQDTRKNNGKTVHTLTLKQDNSHISPNFDLEHYYDEYMYGRSIKEIAECIRMLYRCTPDYNSGDLNEENMRSHLVLSLVNYGTNSAALEESPHIRFLDLAVTFKVNTSFLNIDGFINVDDKVGKLLDLSVTDMYHLALANTGEQLGARMISLNTMVSEMSGLKLPASPDVMVLTNDRMHYGAAAILLPEAKDLMQKNGIEDCFILPSSVHELILINDNNEVNRTQLAELVEDINASEAVKDVEFLSNNVYRYSDIKEGIEKLPTPYENQDIL